MSEKAIVHSLALTCPELDNIDPDDGAAVRQLLLSKSFIEEAEQLGRMYNRLLESFWSDQGITPERAFYGWSVSPQGMPLDHLLSGGLEDDDGRPLSFVSRTLEQSLQQALALSYDLSLMSIESVLVLRGKLVKLDISDSLAKPPLLDDKIMTATLGSHFTRLTLSITDGAEVLVNSFDAEGELLEGSLCDYEADHIAPRDFAMADFYVPRLGLSGFPE